MDLSQRYFNSEGDYKNILEMVKEEPEWSANRIQEGEKAIEEIKKLRDKVTKAYSLITKNSINGKPKEWNEGFDILREIIKEEE